MLFVRIAGAPRVISRVRKRLGGLRGNISGITLLEVLIASAIVGITAVGLLTMFARGQGIIAGEGDNRVAVYLAQQKIEFERSRGFAFLDNPSNPEHCGTTTSEGFSRTMAAVNATSCATPSVFYTRTTVIDSVDANDYATAVACTTLAKAMRVAVTVTSCPKEARPVTLRAVLANR